MKISKKYTIIFIMIIILILLFIVLKKTDNFIQFNKINENNINQIRPLVTINLQDSINEVENNFNLYKIKFNKNIFIKAINIELDKTNPEYETNIEPISYYLNITTNINTYKSNYIFTDKLYSFNNKNYIVKELLIFSKFKLFGNVKIYGVYNDANKIINITESKYNYDLNKLQINFNKINLSEYNAAISEYKIIVTRFDNNFNFVNNYIYTIPTIQYFNTIDEINNVFPNHKFKESYFNTLISLYNYLNSLDTGTLTKNGFETNEKKLKAYKIILKHNFRNESIVTLINNIDFIYNDIDLKSIMISGQELNKNNFNKIYNYNKHLITNQQIIELLNYLNELITIENNTVEYPDYFNTQECKFEINNLSKNDEYGKPIFYKAGIYYNYNMNNIFLTSNITNILIDDNLIFTTFNKNDNELYISKINQLLSLNKKNNNFILNDYGNMTDSDFTESDFYNQNIDISYYKDITASPVTLRESDLDLI